ncbi:MAG: hypothetical protein ACYC0Z_14910 [Acidobacteriaceae bacterium]
MTQQVLYDTKSAIVLQWQDTDQYGYGPVPTNADTLVVTSAEWADQAGTWYVVSGALTQTNPNAPTAAQLLAQAQSAQIAILTAARNAAMLAPVSYTTTGGITAMFSASAEAISYLQGVIDAGSAAWTANLWLSNAGTPITPFTFADVQGLAAAIEAVETPEYQELLKLIGEVMAATTVSAVQGVIWA